MNGRFVRLDKAIDGVIKTLPKKDVVDELAATKASQTKLANARDFACIAHAKTPTNLTRERRKVAQKLYNEGIVRTSNFYFSQQLAVQRYRHPDGTFRLRQGNIWKVASLLCGKSEWSTHNSKYVVNAQGIVAKTPQDQVDNFCDHFRPVYNAPTPPRASLH